VYEAEAEDAPPPTPAPLTRPARPIAPARHLAYWSRPEWRALRATGAERLAVADRLRKQDARVGPHPDDPPEPAPNDDRESLGRIGMTRANGTNGHTPPAAPEPAAPWRCPECRALERTVRLDGSWRCEGCAHEGGSTQEVPQWVRA